jgi:hypothetical protein
MAGVSPTIRHLRGADLAGRIDLQEDTMAPPEEPRLALHP